MVASTKVQFKARQVVKLYLKLNILLYVLLILIVLAFATAIHFTTSNPDYSKISLVVSVTSVLILLVMILAFQNANRLSTWISPDDDAIGLTGKPDAWIVPILQLMGVSLLFAGLFSLVSDFSLDLTKGKWIGNVVVAIFKFGAGWFLMASPRWLAIRLKRMAGRDR